MHKERVMVPSTLIHTLTPHTHTHTHTHTQTHTHTHKHKHTNTHTITVKNVKVVQRVDLIRLKR